MHVWRICIDRQLHGPHTCTMTNRTTVNVKTIKDPHIMLRWMNMSMKLPRSLICSLSTCSPVTCTPGGYKYRQTTAQTTRLRNDQSHNRQCKTTKGIWSYVCKNYGRAASTDDQNMMKKYVCILSSSLRRRRMHVRCATLRSSSIRRQPYNIWECVCKLICFKRLKKAT